jgi:hypothetical protein
MKALEILIDDLGNTTKQHILIWGNLYKGSGFLSLKPTIDELLEIIPVTEKFEIAIKDELKLRLKYAVNTSSFKTRINELLEVNNYRLNKIQTKLIEELNNIRLTEETRTVQRSECQEPISARKLFNRKKDNDSKKYELIPVEGKVDTQLVDINDGHTECRLFDVASIIPLVCEYKYYRYFIEQLEDERINRLDAKPSAERIALTTISKAIREVLRNSGDRVWSNREMFDVIGENYSLPKHFLDKKKFRVAFNKAYSNEAKNYPEILEIDHNYARRRKND